MKFRFRKSLTIIPGVLKWTVSKKSTSLNLNLGIFSKSWGTRGNTTTLDMPGTTGIFWRKETRRKKKDAAARGGKGQTDAIQAPEQPAGLMLFGLFMAVQGLVYWAWASASCDGPIGRGLVLLVGIQIMAYTVIRVMNRLGGFANFALIALLAVAGWFAAHQWIIC